MARVGFVFLLPFTRNLAPHLEQITVSPTISLLTSWIARQYGQAQRNMRRPPGQDEKRLVVFIADGYRREQVAEIKNRRPDWRGSAIKAPSYSSEQTARPRTRGRDAHHGCTNETPCVPDYYPRFDSRTH